MKTILITILLFSTVRLAGYSQKVTAEKKENVMINPAVIEYPRQDLPLFPNPASQQVEIKIYGAAKNAGYVLQIHNSLGNMVLDKPWNGEKIDVSSFPAGVYIVTLKRKQEIYSQKLVVNR